MDFETYQEIEKKEGKKGLIKKILLYVLIALAVVGLVMLIIFAIKNKKEASPLNDTTFAENIYRIKDTAVDYYTLERLPKLEGESVKLTLKEMVDKKLLVEPKDKDGKSCDLKKSVVEVTKLATEYQMKVTLNCSGEEDFIVVYLGCYDYCKNFVCEKVKTTVADIKKTDSTKDPVKTITEKTKSYKYLYKKAVSAAYSAWSDWSADKEYTSSSNIVWGKQELVWNEKNGSKTVTTYVEKSDKSKPIYQETYDNVVGTYKQYVCDGFTYFRDSNSSTTYQSSDWVYSTTKTLSYVPTDTYNTKYVYVGMDYTMCSDSCTLKPYYIYKVYTRYTKAVTQSKDQLSATCNVVEKDITIYGLKLTWKGYLTNKTSSSVTKTYYHTKTRTLTTKAYTSQVWSNSSYDNKLISEGYKYTGIKQEQ